MTETTASSNDATADRATEQARLRKERRQAKLQAGGSARLDKINGLGGRIIGDDTFTPPPVVSSEGKVNSTPFAAIPPSVNSAPAPHHADPDEVDISLQSYGPTRPINDGSIPGNQQMSDAQLRQMMLGLDQPGSFQTPQQGNFNNPMGGSAEGDPIMKMMSQMMGGAGGDGSSPFAGIPGMEGFPNMMQQQPQQPQKPDPYVALWRLLHALVALGLGIYVAILTAFTGSKHDREREAISYDPLSDANQRHRQTFFWVFATAESLLLTTRFFLDKRRGPPPGFVGMALGYLPEPYKGYVEVALRYGRIFSTVRSDILACMFVLGVCSWWKA